MAVNIKKLFDNNFDFAFKAVTYNNMKIAIKSFEQFIRNNEKFFSYSKRKTLIGHLRTYAVEKQFNDSAFNPNASYSVSVKQVNGYKHEALFIETTDFIVNIGRTNNERRLLPASLYKKEYAKANAGLNTQLKFDFLNDVPIITDSKKYAEITYGYRYGEMTHLNIVIPNSEYNGIVYSANLLENLSVYEQYIPNDIVEESIVTLKKALSEEAKKIV